MRCNLCPRKCNINRSLKQGFCGESDTLKIARAALHFGEEPVISGPGGSGTVFFSGCSLRCCFCQNHPISSGNFGKEITIARLADIFMELQEQGAHNINLVSPTHFVPHIRKALDVVGHRLQIPVVYNTGGYETVETLQSLAGYVDVYLTDFKYKSRILSKKYSGAEDYYDFALPALLEMYRQTGAYVLKNGLLQKGIILRHLILPGGRHDSIDIFRDVSQKIPPQDVLVSLMSQYTPCHLAATFPEINRRITSFEYKTVLDTVMDLGFTGFMQERTSATLEQTPDFDLTGC
ncbi:MAG: radical SAM protein [Clostridia bacterium]|nr:radical SAM protein [Clostridia bacterium]